MDYIYWDIDGTLLNTGQAGQLALNSIYKRRTGAESPKFSISEKGKTDRYICWQLFIEMYQRVPSESELAILMDEFERELIQYIETLSITLKVGAKELVQKYYQSDHVTQLLFTGNRKSGAWLKLQTFQIADYFDWNRCVFGDIYNTKYDIVQHINNTPFNISYKSPYFDSSQDRITVIGDTLADYFCSKSLHAEFIGVSNSVTASNAFKHLGVRVVTDFSKDLNILQ